MNFFLQRYTDMSTILASQLFLHRFPSRISGRYFLLPQSQTWCIHCSTINQPKNKPFLSQFEGTGPHRDIVVFQLHINDRCLYNLFYSKPASARFCSSGKALDWLPLLLNSSSLRQTMRRRKRTWSCCNKPCVH